MKISELNIISNLDYSVDAANSYLVLNYIDTTADTPAPVTYKIDLSELKAGLALNNVDNVSDANKPISTAAQAALDLKANTADLNTTITGMGAGKTLSALSETNGVISASFQDISITSAQISDKSDAINSSGSTVATSKAVKDALESLDITQITNTAGKTVATIDEADGKISATFQDIAIAESQVTSLVTDLGNKLETSLKGANNGLAELDENGKVPSSQLPSYVDDVLEGTLATFPGTGETGKIYVDTTTNTSYRWSGSQYTKVASDLSLGETSATAYRGDRGADAYAAAVTNPDASPTENSTNLVKSGGVYTALAAKAPLASPEFTTQISIGSTVLTESDLQTLLLFDDLLDNFDLSLTMPTAVTWNVDESTDALSATPNTYASSTTVTIQQQNGTAWETYTTGTRTGGTHYRAYCVRSATLGSKTYTAEGVVGTEYVEPLSHTLTINYLYSDDSSAATAYEATIKEGTTYTVNSPEITGYTPDIATVTGTMGDSNITVTVTYTVSEPEPESESEP